MIENPMLLPEPNYKPEKGKTFEVDLSFLDSETKDFNRKMLEQFKLEQEAKKRAGKSEVA
jgi:hypothetical protein